MAGADPQTPYLRDLICSPPLPDHQASCCVGAIGAELPVRQHRGTFEIQEELAKSL
jgi:hypothetical protein